MENLKIATLANGCFWCADAVYRRLEGVKTVKSGFTGGEIKRPAYREVVRGLTKHAEAVRVAYDPAQITYRDLLLVFFTTHDPTTLNKQGYDVGPQYRSAIFYHSQGQKQTAESVIDALNKSTFDGKIVTEVTVAKPFYEAEAVHRDFYNQHPEVPYCSVIIDPKLNKLRRHFSDKLKPSP